MSPRSLGAARSELRGSFEIRSRQAARLLVTIATLAELREKAVPVSHHSLAEALERAEVYARACLLEEEAR